jgi:hypothetical protein
LAFKNSKYFSNIKMEKSNRGEGGKIMYNLAN